MKGIGTIFVAFLVVAAAALNSPAVPDDIGAGPRVTFLPDRPRFLSTESATGTLTIKNTTSSEIGYSPIGVTFLIRQPDGSQSEDHWIKSISHPLGTWWIGPGSTQSFGVGLPGCDVRFDPCTQRVAIKVDLESKTQQLAPITTAEFAYVFVPDPNATFSVDGLRGNSPLFITQTQTQDADALARFLDADPLSSARGLSGADADTSAFVGARPIWSLPQHFGSIARASEYFGDRWAYIGPPSLSAVVAADRPEIFALVAVKREHCERLGYDCDAVGVVGAARLAQSLARALGVGVSYVSLVALYQDSIWKDHDTLVPVGVAMTMTGEGSASWRRLPTPTPEPSGFVSYGVVHPIGTQNPLVMNRRTPAPDPVPIDVPDDTSTISALGEVQQTFAADELRLDIKIDSLDSSYSPSPTLPDPRAVAAKLRAQPGVADATGQTDGVGQFPVIYELLLKTYDMAAVERLVTLLQQAYRPLHIGLKYDTSTAIDTCADDIDHAYAVSAKAAMQQAVDAAHTARRHLRRLVLAVAYPLTSGQACEQGAQIVAPEWIYNDRLELPSDHTVRIDARVRLVFRAST